MKKIWLIITCVGVAGFLVLALMPNNKKSSVVSDDAYKFYYYPKLNAYYDFQDGNFVYTIDGGENWLKKKPKNAKLPEKLSQKVMMSAPVPDIWRYNEEHRKAHHGVNTNYLSKDSRKGHQDTHEEQANSISTGEKETDLRGMTATPAMKDEQSDASVEEVTITRKPVQQLPEEEWESDMQKEAENPFNESKKKLIKDVLEIEDSL